MRLLITADVHGSPSAVEMFRELAKSHDAIIIAGDIAPNRRPRSFYNVFRNIVRAVRGKPILFVPGNADPEETLERNPPRENVYNLHARVAKLFGLAFSGIGGSTPTPFRTPNEYPEMRFEDQFVDPGEPFVFVTHVPPRGINDLAYFKGVRHNIGSLVIRRIVEESQPLLHAHGHVHEARGIDRLGSTICVNPGPAKYGYYATAEIDFEGDEPFVKDVNLGLFVRARRHEETRGRDDARYSGTRDARFREGLRGPRRGRIRLEAPRI